MSDTEQLFWILLALTAAVGVVWVRPGGTLFVSQLGGRCRLRWLAGRAAVRNDRGGLLAGNLIPLGNSFVAAPWPLAVSPAGVVAFSASAPTPDGQPDESGAFIPFADLRTAAADGRALLVNGRPFVTAPSKSAATRWAAWLTELRGMPEAKRGPWVERALAASCDPAAAEKAVRACRAATRRLRVLSTVLFAYCFLALGSAAFADVSVPLSYALPGYALLLVLTYREYRRAARAVGGSTGHGWMILVSPADAFRAADLVTRPALEVFHPLALSRAAATPAGHEGFARLVAADLLHPLPHEPFADPRAVEAVRWYAERLNRAVARIFRAAGTDPADYLPRSVAGDPTTRGYCPRCGGQLVRATGTCSTCGVGLRSFAEPPG